MKPLVLVDADVVLYRAGFAAEHKVYTAELPDGRTIGPFRYKKDLMKELEGQDEYSIISEKEFEPLENALYNAKSALHAIQEACGGDLKLYLTGSGNFRQEVATIREYKGNRKDYHKPRYYNELREYLIKYWNAEVVDGQEADDALGIAQCTGNNTIIATLDKDLDMIPGWHYNWVKDVKYRVKPFEADRFFFMQLLMGDPTDNIQGVPKVGAKTAEKILSDCETLPEMLEAVRQEYYAAYNDQDWVALLNENAQLLWIRRKPDEVWEPSRYE